MEELWYTKKMLCSNYLRWKLTPVGLDLILKKWYVSYNKMRELKKIDSNLILWHKVLHHNQ